MNFVDKIIKNKTECIFISPHFDDAILSCGDLLRQLAGKTKISIINVFTTAHSGPYTFSARKFLLDSGNYTDATKLFNAREIEDRVVLEKLRITQINLGLQDGLFRKRKTYKHITKLLPELQHEYPTYKWHLTKKISKNDSALEELPRLLKKYTVENVIFFAPYGIGNHVDHIITRLACEKTFAHLVLYSDFPYNSRLGFYGDATKDKERIDIIPNLATKIELIKLYETQFEGLFPNKMLPRHNEVYFVDKKL